MYLAIDIGATKTLIALFSNHGHCLKRIKFLTNKSKDLFLFELTSNLKKFQNKKLNAIVVAVPAAVQKNYTFSPKNLPWGKTDLLSSIKNLFDCKIFLLNDADLATLYESGFYSGKTIYLTISTGIGGGIAKDGAVTKESATFEPGHKKYSFNDESLDWESFASAKSLKSLFGRNLTKISRPANFETIAYRLSFGIIDIIKTFQPKTIIIGGPTGLILKKIYPFLKSYLLASDIKHLPKIVPARRPTESVIYGCYLYGKFH
ncbi:ROK family protein [Candidatus Saccharibacteria bacterium]|nr:ROK family protein [Candidatus Saccharibacteria bacterium]